MCRAIFQLFDLKKTSGGCKGDKSAAALEVFHYVLLLACNCNISKRTEKKLQKNEIFLAKTSQQISTNYLKYHSDSCFRYRKKSF